MTNEQLVGLLATVITALIAVPFTWMISQATTGKKMMAMVDKIDKRMQETEEKIYVLEKSSDMNRVELSNHRAQTDGRFTNLVGLINTNTVQFGKLIEQNGELIALLRAQNDLMARQENNRHKGG